jgi:hypothetical protein
MTVLDGEHELSDAFDEPVREPWYGSLTTVIALSAVALAAVAIAVSADLVVSRQPVGPTGAVVPSIPVTTTPPPQAPTMAPSTTEAPSQAPAIIPSVPVEPSTTPPPPKPRQTSEAPAPSTSSPPKSAAPTTHRPFPQETTDFLGPPGTNN